MKRTIALSITLVLATISWAIQVVLRGPWAIESASLIATWLVVLAAVAITGMVIASSRWGRYLAIVVALLGPLFGVSVPVDPWWIASLLASGLVLALLAGNATSGVIRKLPAADGPTPRVVVFTLVLVSLPLVVATVSPDGLGPSEWSMVGLTTIGAAVYAKAGPLAVAIVRGLIPLGFVLIGVIDGLPRGAMWIAIGIGIGIAAWHRDIRLAVRPLAGEGRAIPMLAEMVPSEILDAAGLDERGRPVKRP